MPIPHASSVDAALAAHPRRLYGASMSAATITAYRTDLTRFLAYPRRVWRA